MKGTTLQSFMRRRRGNRITRVEETFSAPLLVSGSHHRSDGETPARNGIYLRVAALVLSMVATGFGQSGQTRILPKTSISVPWLLYFFVRLFRACQFEQRKVRARAAACHRGRLRPKFGPSGEKSRKLHETPVWNLVTSRKVAIFHKRTTQSSAELAKVLPSGEKASCFTADWCSLTVVVTL
jgi:hypothetical protein